MARLNLGGRVAGGFWRLLEGIGIKDARRRWRQQPPIVHRAVVPPIIAVVVLLLALPWRQPDLAFVLLLAITYVVYLVPPGKRAYVLPATVLGLAIAYPFYLEHLFTVPLFESLPNMDTMVTMVIFAIMAVGLNMVVGYAGLLDLGYVAFYALGAYTAAWLASPHFGHYDVTINFGSIGVPPGLPGIHISIWLVLIAAALLTSVGGILIGLPTLRLRGDYLAIVTLGFGEIVAQLARNGDAETLGFNLTNGPPGINPIDSPGFGERVSDVFGLPANYLVEQGTYINFVSLMYWTAIALLLLTVFCSIRLRDSKLGRAWIAIREDEVAAAAMGVPLMRTKTWAYASGAFFGGIAGAWFAAFKSGVFPDDFFFNISVFILCMVILGGMGNVWGAIAGAAFLTYLDREGLSNITGWLNENVLPCEPLNQDPSRAYSSGCLNGPLLAFGIYGTIIVLVMLFRPQGLIPEERRKLEIETGVHDEPLMDVRGGPQG